MEVLFIFILAIALLPCIYVVVQYNQFVALQAYIRNSWSNIDTELKRRYDLIPNLVETVKGYAAHEKAVLDRVTELRSRCLASTGSAGSQAADENELVKALQSLFVVVENYPTLKADQNFLSLQKELVNTEDRIQAARRFYNGNVRDYLDKYQSFPTNIIAGFFKFPPVEFFTVEPVVQNVPQVSLGAQS